MKQTQHKEEASTTHAGKTKAEYRHAGMQQHTGIKVGGTLGDFWKKIKGLYPG